MKDPFQTPKSHRKRVDNGGAKAKYPFWRARFSNPIVNDENVCWKIVLQIKFKKCSPQAVNEPLDRQGVTDDI